MLVERHVAATVVDGGLQLDAPLALPNRCRVHVFVEPVRGQLEYTGSQEDRRAALDSFLKRANESPIDTTDAKFTREQLYERD